MRRFVAFTTLIVMAQLAACQAPAVDQLPEQDMAAIKQLVSQRGVAALSSNWDPWWEIYEKDALLVPPYGSPITMADWTASLEPSDLNVKEFSAEVEEIDGRGDLAFVRGTYVEVMSMTEGVAPHEHAGTFVWLLRKQPDRSWRVSLSIWNAAEYSEE